MNKKILFGLFVILMLVFAGCAKEEPAAPADETMAPAEQPAPPEMPAEQPAPAEEQMVEETEVPEEEKPLVEEEVIEGMTETMATEELPTAKCDKTFTLAVVNKGGCMVEGDVLNLKVKKVSTADLDGLLFSYVSQSGERVYEQSPGIFEQGQVKDFRLDLSKYETLRPLKSVEVSPLTTDDEGNMANCLNQRISYPFKNCEMAESKIEG